MTSATTKEFSVANIGFVGLGNTPEFTGRYDKTRADYDRVQSSRSSTVNRSTRSSGVVRRQEFRSLD